MVGRVKIGNESCGTVEDGIFKETERWEMNIGKQTIGARPKEKKKHKNFFSCFEVNEIVLKPIGKLQALFARRRASMPKAATPNRLSDAGSGTMLGDAGEFGTLMLVAWPRASCRGSGTLAVRFTGSL